MEGLPKPMNVEISAIAHATEDLDKVARAVKNLLPSDLRTGVVLREAHMNGHYKNPITTITAKISDRTKAEQIIKDLASRLIPLEKSLLASEFERCVDDNGALYLRFDKQAAFSGSPRLRQEDPIRLRIKFQGRASSVESISAYCKEVGLFE